MRLSGLQNCGLSLMIISLDDISVDYDDAVILNMSNYIYFGSIILNT